MASKPEERPASPPPVTWLAEPLKRFHDEAWHTPQGRLVREVIFGLTDEVDIIVRRVTSSPELWLRVMSREELGLAEEVFDSPVRVGFVTSLAYQLGALLLLIPYAFAATPRTAFAAAAVVAVVALLAIGAGKTWVTKERPVQAALELAGLGILACVIGLVLGWVVGVAV